MQRRQQLTLSGAWVLTVLYSNPPIQAMISLRYTVCGCLFMFFANSTSYELTYD